jgi:hypothetical protein
MDPNGLLPELYLSTTSDDQLILCQVCQCTYGPLVKLERLC